MRKLIRENESEIKKLTAREQEIPDLRKVLALNAQIDAEARDELRELEDETLTIS